VRNESGVLAPASWPEALDAAAVGLAAARGRAGVLTGGRLTFEDAYAYAKFTRIALGTNDIDLRARPHSAEEAQFLAAAVAGRDVEVSYADLERAPAVLLAGFEPEDESPMIFLRLRKAARKGGIAIYSLAPFASSGLAKMSGTLLPTVPGGEADALSRLAGGPGTAETGAAGKVKAAVTRLTGGQKLDEAWAAAADALAADGAVIVAGERLAEVPGALTAVATLAAETGAKLAWVPRRAGELGSIDAGALPGLLPLGRPVWEPHARAEVARAWGVSSLPDGLGRDAGQILAAAAGGELDALVIAGVDPGDLPDPAAALEALDATPFIVSLEIRASAVTDRADVVLPVAAVVEKAGTFVNWEGRPGTFGAVFGVPGVESDLQVLGRIADEMDVHLGLPDAPAARRELAGLGGWPGIREPLPIHQPQAAPDPGPGQAVLATWHQLIDTGRMSDGEPFLAGTAHPVVARMSAATAAQAGTADGGRVTVSTATGTVTVDVRVTAMPDQVVWLPTHSQGCEVRRQLGAGHGTLVTLRSP
jgi:NADH-quinone oxidoreductase subunit G